MRNRKILILIMVSIVFLIPNISCRQDPPTLSSNPVPSGNTANTSPPVTPIIESSPQNTPSSTPLATNIKDYYAVLMEKDDTRILSEKDQKQRFGDAEGAINYGRPIIPEEVIKLAEIKSGDTVVDIGSGHGFLTFPLSGAVGKKGRVFSVDTDPIPLLYQMQVRRKMAMEQGEEGRFYENITLILNDAKNLTLPDNILDAAIICDVHIYHFKFSSSIGKLTQEKLIEKIYIEQKDFTKTVHDSLKPGGRLVLLEKYGGEVALEKKNVIKLLEKMGFRFKEDYEGFTGYQCLVFTR